MSDTHTVRAFLEARHHPWASEMTAFASRVLLERPEPDTDDAARTDARELLGPGLFNTQRQCIRQERLEQLGCILRRVPQVQLVLRGKLEVVLEAYDLIKQGTTAHRRALHDDGEDYRGDVRHRDHDER